MNLGMGESIGFDFNPTVDRIRVTASNEANYRLHPETGALAATDTMLSYAAGDIHTGEDPHIGTIAYINSYKNASSTTLYGVDIMNGAFVSIAPPNAGILNTIAEGILLFNSMDRSTGMDFYYDSATATNEGYFAANSNIGMNDSLYLINESGDLMLIDAIGWGVQIREIATQLRFTNNQSVATKNIDKQDAISFYPNPITDQITIHFSTAPATDEIIAITDISGKIITRLSIPRNSTTYSCSLAFLPQGMYLLKSGTATFKFMKL